MGPVDYEESGDEEVPFHREAAAYLSLSHNTLAKWRCIGGGPKFLKWASAW